VSYQVLDGDAVTRLRERELEAGCVSTPRIEQIGGQR
jgi:hypothetical protein